MKRVWVTHDIGRHNLAMALDFGCLEAVVIGTMRSTLTPDALAATVRRRLQLAEADDHLLLIGNPMVIGMCCAYMLQRFGSMNVLIWDNQCKRYLSQTVRNADVKAIEEKAHASAR